MRMVGAGSTLIRLSALLPSQTDGECPAKSPWPTPFAGIGSTIPLVHLLHIHTSHTRSWKYTSASHHRHPAAACAPHCAHGESPCYPELREVIHTQTHTAAQTLDTDTDRHRQTHTDRHRQTDTDRHRQTQTDQTDQTDTGQTRTEHRQTQTQTQTQTHIIFVICPIDLPSPTVPISRPNTKQRLLTLPPEGQLHYEPPPRPRSHLDSLASQHHHELPSAAPAKAQRNSHGHTCTPAAASTRPLRDFCHRSPYLFQHACCPSCSSWWFSCCCCNACGHCPPPSSSP